MTKLIAAYRNDPSIKNARKLERYERAHPMAVCLLSKEDSELLNEALNACDTADELRGLQSVAHLI